MATVEIVRVVIDHGIWGLGLGVTLFVVRSLARSSPGRELGQIISIEIRWRYLKSKGFPDDELQRLLRDEWNNDGPKDDPTDGDPKSEPPATV